MPLTDKRAFSRALGELAEFHGKKVDRGMVHAYWTVLADRLNDDDFVAACEALKAGEWWPTPARILRAAEAAGSFRRHVALARLYEDVRACDEWGPSGGTVYRLETIRKRCGPLAAHLVQAAGGTAALEAALRRPDEEPFVRKAFMDAAKDLWRSDPDAIRALVAAKAADLLLPQPPRHLKALPAGREDAQR